jgi:tRNA(His) 5'-end guanylyltransferase
MATLAFNKFFKIHTQAFGLIANSTEESCKYLDKCISKFDIALFDSRVYNIPKEEVCNAFIWRQQDATRNAIQMLGQAHFSHKQLQNKNCNEIQEMLFQEEAINFNNLPTYQKRGACIIKETYMKDDTLRTRWIVDKDIPIFTQDTNYIERYL